MYRADVSIDILKYFGIWRTTFLLKRYQLSYNVFSIIMVLMVYIFSTSALLYLLLENPNLDDFTETLFHVLALSTACVKLAIVLFKHDEIAKLRNTLLDKNCHPQDNTEFVIQNKSDEVGRKITIMFFIVVTVSTILNGAAPLMKGSNATLPFKSWTPYDHETGINFWLTYLLQAVGATTAVQVIIAVDTFIMVMMIQLCAQLEILMHRIEQYPQFCLEEKIYKQHVKLGMWIEHHESMYRFGEQLNSIYNFAFFFQLCATTIDVCTCAYLLSIESVTTTKYWRMIISLSGIMLQICLYCWPGNVVMEKSIKIGYSIYNIDWSLLPSSTRLSLLHIMKRSEKPIRFTAGKIFPMTIETLASILRMAFSIYNFLMHSS